MAMFESLKATIQLPETNVENALMTAGAQVERCRIAGESLPSDVRDSVLHAREWAMVSGLSRQSINWLEDEGARIERVGISCEDAGEDIPWPTDDEGGSGGPWIVEAL